jgi:hypothetical protein
MPSKKAATKKADWVVATDQDVRYLPEGSQHSTVRHRGEDVSDMSDADRKQFAAQGLIEKA